MVSESEDALECFGFQMWGLRHALRHALRHGLAFLLVAISSSNFVLKASKDSCDSRSASSASASRPSDFRCTAFNMSITCRDLRKSREESGSKPRTVRHKHVYTNTYIYCHVLTAVIALTVSH